MLISEVKGATSPPTISRQIRMFGKLLSLVIICLLVWAGFERIRRKLGFGGRQKPAPPPFVTLGRIRLSKMEAGIALVIGLYILLSLIAFL